MEKEKFEHAKEQFLIDDKILKTKTKRIKRIITIIYLCIYFSFLFYYIYNRLYIQVGDIAVAIFLPLFGFAFGFIFFIIIGFIVIELLTKKDAKKRNSSYAEYNRLFKEVYVAETLKKTFDNLVYDSNKGLDEEVLKATHMIYTGDIYSSNDYAEGTYKNVRFRQADVHIEEEREETDKDGNTRTYYVTIFYGKWMIFDFNKNFKSNILIEPGIARKYGSVLPKFKCVETESEEFNKHFFIQADDLHDAFYILTPQFMEEVLVLNAKNKKDLTMCFYNNQLFIGLDNGKDSFELDLKNNKSEQEIIDDIYNDIKTITQFIDGLQLDNQLFK